MRETNNVRSRYNFYTVFVRLSCARIFITLAAVSMYSRGIVFVSVSDPNNKRQFPRSKHTNTQWHWPTVTNCHWTKCVPNFHFKSIWLVSQFISVAKRWRNMYFVEWFVIFVCSTILCTIFNPLLFPYSIQFKAEWSVKVYSNVFLKMKIPEEEENCLNVFSIWFIVFVSDNWPDINNLLLLLNWLCIILTAIYQLQSVK